jgi:hypothetical protein
MRLSKGHEEERCLDVTFRATVLKLSLVLIFNLLAEFFVLLPDLKGGCGMCGCVAKRFA